ncbi:coiled-coil domain-containing protein 178 [Tiliqua scincoides]|uniref:coiled-coil domain-containing protein 178 n=1 Tax=Tiliqua scincoides TaxID=71010 RepID=UPI0034619416
MTEMKFLSSPSNDNTVTPKDMNEKMLFGAPAKQRSCAAVNTPSSCVNKAVHHIQDLEVKMEESFQQYNRLYKLEKILHTASDIKSEEAEDSWLSSELKAEQSLYCKDIQPLKWKTVAVLGEVIELVTRLEDERKAAEEALEVEICRRKKLYQNADYLSLWRLQQLPIAVQKEWEDGSQDITEFQCLFKNQTLQLQDAVNQLTRIDIANADIQNNIDFMKKYSPLLGEKMTYEGDAMAEVREIYRKTKSVYDIVHCQLEQTRAAHQQILEEQEQERITMANAIRAAEILLNRLMNELREAENICNDICNKVKEKEAAILQNRKLLEQLIKKDTQIKADIITWHDKIKRLSAKIAEQENENRELRKEYSKSVEEMRSRKSSRNSDLQDLNDRLSNCLQKISEIEDENKYLREENKGFLHKFRESSRRKVAYQAEIRVLQKNIRRLEEHLKKVNKDLYSAELAYEEARSKLEDLEQSIVKEKMRFKNLEDNVKKQIRDEVTAWKLTQKRLRALNAELEEKKREYEKMEAKILKKLRKLEQQVTEQQTALERNKEILKESIKRIAFLNKKIQDLNEKEARIKQELDARKKYLQDLVADIKVKYADISSQLDEVNEKIEKCQKEITNLNAQCEEKQKLLDITERILAELREKYARIKIKEQNAQILVDFLHDRLNYAEKKVKTDSRIFEGLLWNRQKDLKDKKITFIIDLEENLRLAQEYQMLQICFLNDKNKLMDILDYKIRTEEALRDQKQLSRLQSKMHRVLLECFKLRGLHSQAGLAKFQAASHEDVQKILAVQGGLSETVQHTNVFLKSLTDGLST